MTNTTKTRTNRKKSEPRTKWLNCTRNGVVIGKIEVFWGGKGWVTIPGASRYVEISK